MVDFRKLSERTPEQREADRRDMEAALTARLKRKIDRLCAIESGLTQWEMDFIDTIAKRFERGLEITCGMWAKIDEILEQRT